MSTTGQEELLPDNSDTPEETKSPQPQGVLDTEFDRCAHCDTPFDQDTRATKAFIARFVRRGKEVQGEVKITEALQKLYYWKFNGHYEFDKRIKFCDLCGLAFARLYEAMELFDQLAVSHSHLSQLLEAHEAHFRLERGMTDAAGWDASGEGNNVNNTENDFSNELISDPLNQPDEDDAYDTTPLSPRTPYPNSSSKEPYEAFTKSYLCDMCARGFASYRSLRTHLLLTHEIGTKQKECVCHCGKAFFYPYLLANHQKSHSDDRPMRCYICDARFKTKSGLNHHVVDVHEAVDRPYICKVCGKGYKEERSLREHFNINHIPTKKLKFYECKYNCGAKTPRKRSLYSHYKHCHRKRQMEESSLEDTTTQDVQSIEVLIQTKDDGSVELINVSKDPESTIVQNVSQSIAQLPLRFPCPEGCGRTLKSKASLRKHRTRFCLKRKDAPVRLRIHKRNYPQHANSSTPTITVQSEDAQDIDETHTLKHVPVGEVMSVLPIEIMDSTGDNSCEEIITEQCEDDDGTIPIFLESVKVDDDYIKPNNATITFHEVMDMDDHFSAL